MSTRTVPVMGVRSQDPGYGSVGKRPLDGAYVLEGSVLEACQATSAAGLTERPAGRSVAAWRIGTGRINGVDVSGQVVVVIAARGAPEGPVARVILLDERASPDQLLALLDAFRGRLGGPLGELAGGEEWGFSQVPIEYRLAGGQAVVSVPDRLTLVARLDLPWHAPSGQPAARCVSEVSVEIPEHGFAWHGDAVPATYRSIRMQR